MQGLKPQQTRLTIEIEIIVACGGLSVNYYYLAMNDIHQERGLY